MDEPHPVGPPLIINALVIREMLATASSCFALSTVEEGGITRGCLVLRPSVPVPTTSTRQGFRFGHSVLGAEGQPVLHFAFEFYDHALYHGLVIPGNPLVQTVLGTMCATKDYFFLALNPDQTVTAFRSHLEHEDLAGLQANREHWKQASCTPTQYTRALTAFTRTPDPPGQVMEWVCRDNWEYLDLQTHRLALNPSR